MQIVEEKMEQIKIGYAKSDLPEKSDMQKAEEFLVEIRERFYNYL